MKCDELKPLVFSISDLAYVDEPTPQPNFQNPHDHAVYKATEVEAAIAELKAKLDKAIAERDGNQVCIDALKQKLENVQASMYVDVVDANMENRRLRRELWLARARGAHNAAMMWEILSDEYLIGALFTIDFRCIGDPDVTEFQIFRTCIDWMKIYENVERKCRAKAEEYK